jgi:hypothetical protein
MVLFSSFESLNELAAFSFDSSFGLWENDSFSLGKHFLARLGLFGGFVLQFPHFDDSVVLREQQGLLLVSVV